MIHLDHNATTPAVLETCGCLQRRFGYRLTVVGVDATGRVDPDDVRRSTLQPIAEIAGVARERGVTIDTDAAQSVGKIAVDVDE